MSPKKKEGKRCPGVSKQGNPCQNFYNSQDDDGFCGRCRRRANATAKAVKKEAKRQAKVVAENPSEQLDYDPAEILPCKARPGVCHAEVKVGREDSKHPCAMAVNPSKMADVTRRNRAKSTPLEKARFDLARGLQSQLFSLQEGGGPFVICDECQQGLIELFERDDIFLPFSFARRKYQERQDVENERQNAAEAKAEALKQEVTDQERRRQEQQEKRDQQKVDKASAFMAGLTVAPDEVEKGEKSEKGDKPSVKSLIQEWMRDLIAGKHNDAHVKAVFLPKVETDEVHVCSNPHCREQGSMAEVARDGDGQVILVQRNDEEVPLPKMWISWQPLQLTHKQGNLQGQVIVDQGTGEPVIKNKPVVLCSQCGNVLRRTPWGDEPRAYTTPLSVAVDKAVANRRERDSRRWNGESGSNGNGSDGQDRPSRRGRGRGGMKAHDFGHADPKDLQEHCGGDNGRASGAVATLSDVAGGKSPKYLC